MVFFFEENVHSEQWKQFFKEKHHGGDTNMPKMVISLLFFFFFSAMLDYWSGVNLTTGHEWF